MGGAKNPEEQIIIYAQTAGKEGIKKWVNLSSIDIKQKNRYQINWPQKAKAYELFDNNGLCIADCNELGLCRRRLVFVPY
jgi:hypothetical protein